MPRVAAWAGFGSMLLATAALAFPTTRFGTCRDPAPLGEGAIRHSPSIFVAPLNSSWFGEPGSHVFGQLDFLTETGNAESDGEWGQGLVLNFFGKIPGHESSNVDLTLVAPVVSYEWKLHSGSGNSALLIGVEGALPLLFDGDSLEVGSVTVSAWVGGAFAWGDPGSTRLIVSPRLIGWILIPFWYSAALSLAFGLSIPLGNDVALLPEVSVTCSVVADRLSIGNHLCTVGMGTAVSF